MSECNGASNAQYCVTCLTLIAQGHKWGRLRCITPSIHVQGLRKLMIHTLAVGIETEEND